MPYRLVGRADDRIGAILFESARQWGMDGAARYHRLMFAALDSIAAQAMLPGSRPVPGLMDVRSYHLRSARGLVAREYRVTSPRHLVLYRLADDGTVDVLGLVHDRQLLRRAARRAQSEAAG